MFVEDILKNGHVKALSKGSGSFTQCYRYWINTLMERCSRLFVWEGVEDVPTREIEFPLLFTGKCVVAKYKGTVTPFYGDYSGAPTVFYDVWESASIYSPVHSEILKLGKKAVLMRNDDMMNGVYPIAHRHAVLLAHTEVSLINTLVNGRDASGVPVVGTEAQKTSVEAYRAALMEGRVGAVMDKAFLGVDFKKANTSTALSVHDLVEAMQTLLESFYNAIGVRTSHSKKGNMIVEEITSNDAMIMLNIDDMLECRQEACKEINRLFGTNWSVRKASILEYDDAGQIVEEKEENEDGSELQTDSSDISGTAV